MFLFYLHSWNSKLTVTFVSSLKITFHCLLASIFVLRVIFFYNSSLSLPVLFCGFIVMILGMNFLLFTLLRIHLLSWITVDLCFIASEKLFPYIAVAHFFQSLPSGNSRYILDHFILSSLSFQLSLYYPFISLCCILLDFFKSLRIYFLFYFCLSFHSKYIY